jgi:HAD superfamily hydrolase (TIGR01509 family)
MNMAGRTNTSHRRCHTDAYKGKITMTVKAILFGSIGTLVETSDFQRRAFNQAFAQARLDWNWDTETYARLLTKSGGQERIQNFADERSITVNSHQLHQHKTVFFNNLLANEHLPLRPGVRGIIDYAKMHDIRLAFVTATSRANIDATFLTLGDQISRKDFAFIGDVSMVSAPKPNPDIYKRALADLNLDAHNCIAIEDTATSMHAALAAGLRCIAFPGAYAKAHDFTDALLITQNLSSDNFQATRPK